MSGVLRVRRGAISHEVTIQPAEAGWAVTIGDETHHVGAQPLGEARRVAGASVTELLLTAAGRSARAVVAQTRERLLVALGGNTYAFELVDEQAARGGAAAGTGRVVAPMPGKVIAVLVEAGTRIEAGDPVVVLEAMKMETTLAAEVSGEVAAVHVAVGATVDGDVLLVEIAPDEDHQA